MTWTSVLYGLGPGAIIAAIALGLVITYRASGVINFAHGAIAAYVTYIFISLTKDGQYPVPPLPDPLEPLKWIFGYDPIHLPTFVDLGGGEAMGSPPAFAVAMLSAALIGFLLHILVFRPLRYAPTLAKVVASIGVMLALQAAIVLRFSARPQIPRPILPDEPVDIFGASVPRDRFLVLLVVIVCTLVLWAVYRYTRFGVATRAAAEQEQFATLVGVNADRLAALNWMLAAMLAGLVGILTNTIIGVTPSQLTLLVIPALGAALLGKMSSFGIAAASGLALGIADQGLFAAELNWAWLPDINLRQAVPFIVIAVAMMVRGESLPTRSTVAAERMPFAYAPALVPWRVVTYTLFVAFTAYVVVFTDPVYRGGMQTSIIGMILALSLVVVTGYVGQISLMQMAIAGISAFSVGSLGQGMGVPFPISMALAILCGLGFGLVAALPSLRTRGAALAIVTLASGLAITQIFFARSNFFGLDGTSRMSATPSIFGLEFGPSSPFFGDQKLPSAGFGLFTFLVALVCALFVMRLRRSRLGEQMLAVRANERAAAAAGVNVAAIKLTAFGISSLLAGTAGALMAFKLGTYGPTSFDLFTSIAVLAFAYLGGISTVGGAVVAGAVFTDGIAIVFLEHYYGLDLGPYTAYIAGVLLVVTAVFNNEGMDAVNRAAFYKLVNRLRPRRGVPAANASMVTEGSHV